jgi:hypothetical protein
VLPEGFEISAVDPDADYLGIEIRASSGRFAGSTRIYAGLHELSEFAAEIEGFPMNSDDRRTHEFGKGGRNMRGDFAAWPFGA